MGEPLPCFTLLHSSQLWQLQGVPAALLEANLFSYFYPCFFLLFQSPLQVTVTQADLRLQCRELQWTTELLSSSSSYIHVCNQIETKQSRFGFNFANPAEIWASCVPDVISTYRMLECSFNYLRFQCLPIFELLQYILNFVL